MFGLSFLYPAFLAAASAAATSQLSIASMKAWRALLAGGTADSSTGAIVQSPSLASLACDSLKLSSAQKMGSQRS